MDHRTTTDSTQQQTVRPADLMDSVAEIIIRSKMLTFIVSNPVGSVWNKLEQDSRKKTPEFGYYAIFKCVIVPESLAQPSGRQEYVTYGRRILKDFLQPSDPRKPVKTPLLVCYDFGAVIIAALRHAKILGLATSNPACTSVELYHAGRKGDDHAFVVVNRDPRSDEKDLRTWGDGAFVIDAWYAAQRRDTVGSCPVKGVQIGGPHYDVDYVDWLTKEPLSVTANFS
jgi:hypothetical protein